MDTNISMETEEQSDRRHHGVETMTSSYGVLHGGNAAYNMQGISRELQGVGYNAQNGYKVIIYQKGSY